MQAGNAAIGVIIAAWNAAPTIARAIASALAQPQVAEVIVVDDASNDETVRAAREADDQTGRLRVLVQPVNAGPSAARNRAIAESSSPLLSILDADDFLLPNRFASMLVSQGWDLVADNIVFVDDDLLPLLDISRIAAHRVAPQRIGAACFVERSISRPDRPGRELAFAKPIMRRAFLEGHALLYDETLRLGEDYDLYLRALQAGARFLTTSHCGYVAVGRSGSLSRDHAANDLYRFEQAIRRALRRSTDARLSKQLRAHVRQTLGRRAHRELLDRKRQDGLIQALSSQASDPLALIHALANVIADKLGRRRLPINATESLPFLL